MARFVQHNRYGRGQVLQSRYGGFELLVRFKDNRARWIRLSEVSDLSADHDSAPKPPKPTKKRTSDQQFTARRMIEAFRLGVVPFDCLDDFTFGRADELKAISRWLADDEEGVLFLVGEYGAGKTHLLHHIFGQALDAGYVVANVEMDPGEAPFHRPKRVYSRMARSLRFRDPDTGALGGFRLLLRGLVAQGVVRDHRYFSCLARADEDELLWEWIEATQTPPRPEAWTLGSWGYQVNAYGYLPGLYDFATAANLYTYLLTGIGWAAHRGLGLRGLLLLCDESESVAMTDTSYQWEKGVNFFRALVHTACNVPSASGPPASSGLDYCGVGCGPGIPFAYRQPSRIKIVFAVTPGFAQFAPTDGRSFSRVELDPLQDETLRELYRHIASTHARAYSSRRTRVPGNDVLRRLLQFCGSTRMFVKASVEVLDVARFKAGLTAAV